MTDILITGAAGFIGYHTAKYLAKNKNNNIVLVDNLHRGQMDEQLKKLMRKDNVTFLKLNVTDKTKLKKINRHFNYVYHFAAIVGVKHCGSDPVTVLKINIHSVENIIDLAIKNKWDNIYFSSTSEVYAGSNKYGILPIPTKEEVPLCIPEIYNPRFTYAASKMIGELYVYHCFKKTNIRFYIGRYHNVYGPRMGYSHVIPEVIKRMYMREDPFKIYGFDQTRAFCYIDDAVRLTVALMKKKPQNGIYHIGNPYEEIKIEKLVMKLFDLAGYAVTVKNTNAPEGSVSRRCPDIKKIIQNTGYNPSVTLNEGLKKTYTWYMKNLKSNNVWE